MNTKTLFDKIWDAHVVKEVEGGPSVLYIDRHLIHEVTSPVAFLGLETRGLTVLRPEKTIATPDHNVPTINQHLSIKDELSRHQVEMLKSNCAKYGIVHHGLGSDGHGVVHIIGPEMGITQPGMTIVCGDSHTSTHGAFGAIAFGIGTSEVEMVFASQCVMQPKPKKMRISVNGELNKGVTAKDIALYVIAQISTSGGTGHFVEFAGTAIESLSMEGRMTLCNMSIECGARGGLIAPDEVTFNYLKGREFAPKGEEWNKKLAYWKTLFSDKDATFDKVLTFDASDIEPQITYGTNPGMGMGITQKVPVQDDITYKKALEYMKVEAGKPLLNTP
ncbi:MAG: aconitase family protein, partial [Bacteroidota bacterium]|nr:aconitase family protein [Bacteroidota bacterium]